MLIGQIKLIDKLRNSKIKDFFLRRRWCRRKKNKWVKNLFHNLNQNFIKQSPSNHQIQNYFLLRSTNRRFNTRIFREFQFRLKLTQAAHSKNYPSFNQQQLSTIPSTILSLIPLTTPKLLALRHEPAQE